MNFTKKTLLCYTTGRPNTSKIILNFARGVNRQDDGWVAEVIEIDAFLKSGIPHHADAVMSLGILRGTGLLMQTAAEKRIDRYYMDHAYFNPGYDATKQSWMRICKNRHTMNWLGGSDGSRHHGVIAKNVVMEYLYARLLMQWVGILMLGNGRNKLLTI